MSLVTYKLCFVVLSVFRVTEKTGITRRFVKKLLFLIIILASAQARSSGVDYIGYLDRVKLLTELVVSAKSCENFEMIVDWERFEKIPDQLIADAIRSGVDVEFAQSAIIEGMREKTSNEEFLFKFYVENPEKMEEYVKYWAKKCINFSMNSTTKEFIWIK